MVLVCILHISWKCRWNVINVVLPRQTRNVWRFFFINAKSSREDARYQSVTGPSGDHGHTTFNEFHELVHSDSDQKLKDDLDISKECIN